MYKIEQIYQKTFVMLQKSSITNKCESREKKL